MSRRVSASSSGFGKVVASLSDHPGIPVSEMNIDELGPLEAWHGSALSDSFFRRDQDPLRVALGVVVINLADIETLTQSYRARLEMWVAWPLTKEEVTAYIKDPHVWEPTLRPRPSPWTIHIEDEEQMRFASDRTTQVFIWRDKVVACECTLTTARFLESMELENFPFDCQHLTFSIAIRSDCDLPLSVTKSGKVKAKDIRSIGGYLNFDARTMREVTLDPQGCAFNVRNYLLSLQDFVLHNIETEIEMVEADVPFLHCSLRLSRNYQQYLTRIFLNMFLLTTLAVFVLTFPSDVLGDRLNYVSTSLLTVVAFLFLLSQTLPNLPYLTLIDRYMIGVFAYIVTLAGQCIALDFYDKEESDVEWMLLGGNLGIVIIGHVLLALYCQRLVRWERRKLLMNRREVDRMYESRNSKSISGADQFIAHGATPSDKDGVHVGGARQGITHGWLFDPDN